MLVQVGHELLGLGILSGGGGVVGNGRAGAALELLANIVEGHLGLGEAGLDLVLSSS